MRKELNVEFVVGNEILEVEFRVIDVSGVSGDYRLSEIIEIDRSDFYEYVEYIHLNNCVENEDGTLTLKIEVTRSNEFLVELIKEQLDGSFANQENMEEAASELLANNEITQNEYDNVIDYIDYELFVA